MWTGELKSSSVPALPGDNNCSPTSLRFVSSHHHCLASLEQQSSTEVCAQDQQTINDDCTASIDMVSNSRNTDQAVPPNRDQPVSSSCPEDTTFLRMEVDNLKGTCFSKLRKKSSVSRQSSARSSVSQKNSYAPAEITRLIDSSDRYEIYCIRIFQS